MRGARAGKHVLCEKPMATSVADAEKMVDACKQAGKKLMIAYRIQYEPFNRAAKNAVRNKEFGAVKVIEMANAQDQGTPESMAAQAGDVGRRLARRCRHLLSQHRALSHGRGADVRAAR